MEDEYFCWGFFIPGEVGVHGLQGESDHGVELLLSPVESSGAAEDGGEGGVDCGAHAQRVLVALFDSFEGKHHG